MFDLSTVNRRYFDLKLDVVDDDTGEQHALRLSVNPCRVKTLKKFMSLVQAAPETVTDELVEAVRGLLSNNRQHKVVTKDFVEEMSLDEMLALVSAYMDWFGKEKETDPN
jgi:hypothetical protein